MRTFFCFVQFLVTRGTVVPAAIVPIMSGRVIQSFRHLKHKNPSIILDIIVKIPGFQIH